MLFGIVLSNISDRSSVEKVRFASSAVGSSTHRESVGRGIERQPTLLEMQLVVWGAFLRLCQMCRRAVIVH